MAKTPPIKSQEGRPTPEDLYYFNQGTHFYLDRFVGARPTHENGQLGVRFTVWAPNAERVAVIADFTGWYQAPLPLEPVASSGLWSGFSEKCQVGDCYKYAIWPQGGGPVLEKADPMAFFFETPPKTASRVWDLQGYGWRDQAWLSDRAKRAFHREPVSIYEVHLGSWRALGRDGEGVSYRGLARSLPAYVSGMGFTHVEFLPVMEHPFYGSWGYQSLGYFAPTSRYGTPQDFMYLVDELHQAGIGVILDWVPAHFPQDGHGLGNFDGTHLYEHRDQRQGIHPDWGSYIYNYGRHEVASFLLSSAMFWIEKYHADGLRVDAVASMLYLDYSRGQDYVPNVHGGNANLEAISFLQTLNRGIYQTHPDILMMAEESTSWPGVSRPVHHGGLGFGFKWDMGWMHDTLEYFHLDPVYRKHHHGQLMFRMNYAFSENFVLPLSHDEVVHGKGSLLQRMPGDFWQQMANLRVLYGYQFTMSGKKLLFMGDEWGEPEEWRHDQGLDWTRLSRPLHRGMVRYVRDLNRLYRRLATLYDSDTEPDGVFWADGGDAETSVFAYIRRTVDERESLLVVINATPVARRGHSVRVPSAPGTGWQQIFSSDELRYGGAGWSHPHRAVSEARDAYGSWLSLDLPALAMVVWAPKDQKA